MSRAFLDQYFILGSYMKKFFSFLLFVPLMANASLFNKNYSCGDAIKAQKEYDGELLADIFDASTNEAMDEIYEFYGGENKFKSKSKSNHPVITMATLELKTMVTKVEDLCSSVYSHNNKTLLSDVIVSLYKGEHSQARDAVKLAKSKETCETVSRENATRIDRKIMPTWVANDCKDLTGRDLYAELESQSAQDKEAEKKQRQNAFEQRRNQIAKVKEELHLIAEQECVDAVSPAGYAPSVKIQSRRIEFGDGSFENIEVRARCQILDTVKLRIAEIKGEQMRSKEAAKASKEDVKTAKALQRQKMSCKATWKQSNSMRNVFKVKDFFANKSCPALIPEEYESLKQALLVKQNGNAMKATLRAWKIGQTFDKAIPTYADLSPEAKKFYEWLESNTPQ